MNNYQQFRIGLCKYGASNNKLLCDGLHIGINYKDE